MSSENHINEVLGHFFRHESGKMVAVLTRLLGFNNLDDAHDIVQDTLLKAMTVWKYHGLPENPSAWLYAVARNKAIDVLRKEKKYRTERLHHQAFAQSEWTLVPTVHQLFLKHEIEDSQLRMIFACCHPSIPFESQIALTLKTLCGLRVHEIARAFLTNEETITKRLYRAREKIRQEKINLDTPDNLAPRLDAVLKTLYLLFNEGYHSSHPDILVRQDLCEEAMRLTHLLTQHDMTNTPATNALLALCCFQASRFDSRLDDKGQVLLLKHQDRSRWDKDLIAQGKRYLNRSAEGNAVSEYHIEAAIAAGHACADDFEKTDWKQMLMWYDMLSHIKPGPVVAMNRAIVVGYARGPAEGIKALREISGMEKNHLYHTALGDFLNESGQAEQARACYATALLLTTSHTERLLIQRKLEEAR